MSILLGSYHHEFLAGLVMDENATANILKWNQLYLKEEGLCYTFQSKSFFTFYFFPPILAFISLSVTDNMVLFYTD